MAVDTFNTSLSLMQVLSFAFFVMFVVGVAATACAFVYSLAVELADKRRVAYRRATW